MKFTYHIPTEQYGFVEVELEGDEFKPYSEVKRMAECSTEGVSVKEFNNALDRYLTENTGDTDLYSRMSKGQQAVFQEIKKSLSRIKNKNGQ